MQPPEDLLTVFSGEIEERDDTPVIRLPERELRLGDLSVGDTYRIAIIQRAESGSRASEPAGDYQQPSVSSEPPVEEGERHEVEIEDIGDQGDGIARVGPGYIVFVPEADVGDRVTVEITDTRENFGFAEVIDAEPIVDR